MIKDKKSLSVLTLIMLSSVAGCGSRQSIPGGHDDMQMVAEVPLQVAEQRPTSVSVKAGDTVYGIAYRYGLTTRSVIAANSLTPPYKLVPGQELKLPAPREHVVIDGEDLEGIASFYAIDMNTLLRENELDAGSKVAPGDRLIIPSRDTAAVAESIIESQETIISSSSLQPLDIAPPKEDGVSTAASNLPDDIKNELAREIAMGDEAIDAEIAAEKAPVVKKEEPKPVAKKEEPAKVAGKTDDKKATAPVKTATAAATKAVTTPAKATTAVAKAAPKPETTKAVADTADVAKKAAPAATASAGDVASKASFNWPAKGKVLSKYGTMADGTKNDGINIAVAEGTAVNSAGDGEVVYAGDALKGFGNLVLVKHSNGYVTAYGHNAKLLVKKGDKVKVGQQIAKSGKSGDVQTPQLHFEIRKGTQPVDPMTYLGS